MENVVWDTSRREDVYRGIRTTKDRTKDIINTELSLYNERGEKKKKEKEKLDEVSVRKGG